MASKTSKTSSLKRLLVASVPCYYYCLTRAEGWIPNPTTRFTDVSSYGRYHGRRKDYNSYSGLGGVATTIPSAHGGEIVRLFSATTSDESIEKKQHGELSETETTTTTTFATTYHAPVMVNECLDGLLDCERGRIRNPNPKSYKKNKNKNKQWKNKKNTKRNVSANDDETESSERTTTTAAAPANDETTLFPSLIFVDGTLGGGGHSNALLRRLRPGDVLFGCDIDPNALATASERLSEYTNHSGENKPLFVPVLTNFGDLVETLPTIVHPITGERILGESRGDGGGVDGILLDLGVSSHQIDEPERGFSFMRDGPLDMRMGAGGSISNDDDDDDETSTTNNNNNTLQGLTAADICNEFDRAELKRIFKVYGDEQRAWAIAGAIIDRRPLHTTGNLKDAIAAVTPKFAKNKRHGLMATCARVFQSLRIVVNNEDGVLSKVLSEACPGLLDPGGRLVVMSYHSMEDRATKRIMRDGTLDVKRRGNGSASTPEKDMYGNDIGPPKPFQPVSKRRRATDDEIVTNPRARSAILRVAEKNNDYYVEQ